ncbi:MAG: hypothetical protein QOJ63_2780 [Solirubrobacteraceae bacterium]|nr:hypothetical protein [Solirubrobacteraceae bacterium]
MLFDLRGRGRRRTVQAIYLGLALLIGGGLVGFGMGSSTSGGIVDAVIGDGSSGDSATKTLDKRVERALANAHKSPRDPKLWAELARLRYQRAGIDGIAADEITYTAEGKQKLALAAQAWERHLALDPPQPDARVARLMTQAYGSGGLNEPAKAVRAMEVVTAAEKPPSSNLYAQLAQLAYTAHEIRTGDLAAARAIDLAPKANRTLLRSTLKQLKTSAAAKPATQSATPVPSG